METKPLDVKAMTTKQLITKMRENVKDMKELEELCYDDSDEYNSLCSELDEMRTEFYSRRDYKKYL